MLKHIIRSGERKFILAMSVDVCYLFINKESIKKHFNRQCMC